MSVQDDLFDVRGSYSPAEVVRGLRRVCLGSVDSQSASFKPLCCAVCSLPSYRAVREPRPAIVFIRNSYNGRPQPACATHAVRSACFMGGSASHNPRRAPRGAQARHSGALHDPKEAP